MTNFQTQQMLDEQRRKQVERETQSENLTDLVRFFSQRFVEAKTPRPRESRQTTR